MRNITEIVNWMVKNNVWIIVDCNIDRFIRDTINDNVIHPVWGIRVQFAVWRTVDKHHNLFKYNSLQQYKDNI
jgi:hypothetical protein